MSGKTNKERLAAIEVKLDVLVKHFENHLHMHQRILLLCIGTALTASMAFVGWGIKVIVSHFA